jgi:hypothetical protein
MQRKQNTKGLVITRSPRDTVAGFRCSYSTSMSSYDDYERYLAVYEGDLFVFLDGEQENELSLYFRKEFHAEAFVDMQPISSTARSDEVPSAFYFWVRASTEDAKQYRAGTARVVLRVDSKCDVTGFISKADILASRARLADFFPADLVPKILWFAETPQK